VLPLGLRILLGEADVPPHKGDPTAKPAPSVVDWLDLNNLDRKTVRHHLDQIVTPCSPDKYELNGQSRLDLSSEEAWASCAKSLRSMLPDLSDVIEKVEKQTPRCLMPNIIKYPKPFTYDLGYHNLPFISLHYQGRKKDFLAMTHEFGHAVQIVASWESGEGQMPPVARECCAFIAELACVQALEPRTSGLGQSHHTDNTIYFGANKAELEQALLNETCPYQYDWNYPLARHFASQIFRKCASSQLSELFRSGLLGPTMLCELLACSKCGEAAA